MNTLPERLALQAARTPEAVAIIHGARRATYGELAEEVGRLTAGLVARGVLPGDRVAILADNSVEAVVALYAVLGAGAVAVALNAAARGHELAGFVTHSGARLLLGQAGHAELAPLMAALAGEARPPLGVVVLGTAGGQEPGGRAIVPEGAEAWADWRSWFAPMAPAAVEAADPATIVYTSGTTGAPKGVVLTHGNYIANVDSILEYLRLDATDRVLCLLPFYYSYGASVLHTHLAVGGSLVLENSLAFPGRVLERGMAERVTGLPGVPSTFALLLRRTKLATYDLSSLRYLTQAGGGMAPAMADELRAALPHVRLIIMYGQTEATARLTWLPPERLVEKRGSCGRAIPGVELRVVDSATGAVLPTGEVGEVCAQGDNVMAGYWHNRDATRAVLHEGWLHTGDIGHLDAEGFLFLQGRRSDMIKSGAHRISPLEIDEVLLGIDGVAEAAAVGVDDELLGQVVKAVLVLRPGASVDAMAVQRRCREVLAMYKVPKYVEFVAELPKTPSGKVIRHRLATHLAAPQEVPTP